MPVIRGHEKPVHPLFSMQNPELRTKLLEALRGQRKAGNVVNSIIGVQLAVGIAREVCPELLDAANGGFQSPISRRAIRRFMRQELGYTWRCILHESVIYIYSYTMNIPTEYTGIFIGLIPD